jgi:hypothetical protein
MLLVAQNFKKFSLELSFKFFMDISNHFSFTKRSNTFLGFKLILIGMPAQFLLCLAIFTDFFEEINFSKNFLLFSFFINRFIFVRISSFLCLRRFFYGCACKSDYSKNKKSKRRQIMFVYCFHTVVLVL